MKRLLVTILFTAALAVAQTAMYPTAIPTDSHLKVAKNFAASALSAGINGTATSITVASGTGFVSNSLVRIDNEIISICNVAGNTLTVGHSACPNVDGRAFDGTSAASHTQGTVAYGYIMAWDKNVLAAEVKAVDTALGVNLANVLQVSNNLSDVANAAAARSNLGIVDPFGGVTASAQLQFLRRKPNVTGTVYEFATEREVNSADYNFPAQSPGVDLTAGNTTITLTPVPLGVNWNDPGNAHWVYVSGGTDAAGVCYILTTGPGTATSGAASGTLTLTCAAQHRGAYTVTSAGGGLQEAICAAPTAGGRVTLSSATTLYANVGACGKTDVTVIKESGAVITGAFTVLGQSGLSGVSGHAFVSNSYPPAQFVGYPTPYADIRAFGAVCNGTDQNTAIQAAITAGAKNIFIPSGCMWKPPGDVITAGLTFTGENWLTSIISSSNPVTTDLALGAGTSVFNMNLKGQGCTSGILVGTGGDCPQFAFINSDTAIAYANTTGYSWLNGSVRRGTGPGDADFGGINIGTRGTGDAIFLANEDHVGTPGFGGGVPLRIWQQDSTGGGAGILVTKRNSGLAWLVEDSSQTDADLGIDAQFFYRYKTAGDSLNWAQQGTATYTGSLLSAAMGQTGSTFNGYFINFNNGGVAKFTVDSGGNLTTPAVVQAGSISGGNLTLSANESHIITHLAQSDVAGQIAITSPATTGAKTFVTAYAAAPVCTISPTSNPGAVTWWVTTSTTAVTVNLSAGATITFNYVCVGNPN